MAKKKRRTPQYLHEDPMWREAEARRRAGIPPDAVVADPTQRAPNNSYSPPPLYYRDYDFDCSDCGSRETWTAEQQKWWYEVAKGSIYSGAVRCRKCRAARRAANAKRDGETS